jgi:hypothetical protein
MFAKARNALEHFLFRGAFPKIARAVCADTIGGNPAQFRNPP